MKTKILYTRLFKSKFMQCLSRYPLNLQIAVPFIGKIPDFGSISDFSRFIMSRGDCNFQLITRPPKSGKQNLISPEEAAIIAGMGVDLMIRCGNTLHSKIYQFTFREGDRAAFVGSANFSMGGFKTNHETMAYFQGKGENDEVAKEIDLIAHGAYDFAHWRAISVTQSNNRQQEKK